MSVLVLAEHNNQNLLSSTFNVIEAASKINDDIHLLICGNNTEGLSQEAKKILVLKKVINCDDQELDNMVAEKISPIILSLAKNYTHILAPATTFGKNILPRVAALLDISQISDVIGIEDHQTFIRPIYAGNAIAHVQSPQALNLITIRPTAFERCETMGGEASIENIPYIETPTQTRFINREVTQSDRPDLSNAKIVISGGRGLENADNFKLIYELADKLKAAVGASRAAVDSGYIGNEHQVGQTGKMVAPDLYIAIGISGAIQHLAGMKESKVIVAINKDVEAPIFKIADYGLNGDLFQVIPELMSELDLLNKIES
jgi:electron transfer flavoprotein alpha subunit